MRDPLDTYLPRLPSEAPSANLSGRIILAVARRQQTQRMWARVRLLMLISALVGVALVLISWTHVATTLSPAVTAVGTNDLTPAYNALVAAPADTVATWLDAGLDWQTAQAGDIGIMFTLGIALLSAAAFAGLAQMLNTSTPSRSTR